MWKILKEMGIPDHLTCLLRNLYTGQEATVEPHMEQQIGSKLGKECTRLYIVNLLFHFYAVYIMGNVGLDEAQARIKIARKNISNLRYADDTTLMAESEEELKSLSMRVKEKSEKAGLKPNI